jgi:hypothetical protein
VIWRVLQSSGGKLDRFIVWGKVDHPIVGGEVDFFQIIFDLKNQDRSNLILLRKDRGGKSRLLLIGKPIAYRLINLSFYLGLNNVTIM